MNNETENKASDGEVRPIDALVRLLGIFWRKLKCNCYLLFCGMWKCERMITLNIDGKFFIGAEKSIEEFLNRIDNNDTKNLY